MDQRDVFTLQELALAQVAIYLWTINPLPDIQSQRHQFLLEKNVIDKVKKLIIEVTKAKGIFPVTVVNKLKYFIKIVGKEINKLLFQLGSIVGINNMKLKLIISRLCWMNGGILDSKQTIFKSIQNEDLCVMTKFELASNFCIEGCVKETWNNLSDIQKINYLIPIDRNLTVRNIWAFKLSNQEDKLEDTVTFHPYECINEYIIHQIVHCFNIDAIDFFFKKVSDDRKVIVIKGVLRSIYRLFPNRKQWYIFTGLIPGLLENSNSLIVYLFSHIKTEYFEEVVNNPMPTFRILGSYLDWPNQKLFLEKAKMLKDFMTDVDFNYINSLIKSKILLGYKDFEYQSLLDQNNMFSRSLLISD